MRRCTVQTLREEGEVTALHSGTPKPNAVTLCFVAWSDSQLLLTWAAYLHEDPLDATK